uniref:Uncharacterized protein n=1 Tax=Triticum urartu TaxID=4572 RepID=A0A8R7P9R8_TRIUA
MATTLRYMYNDIRSIIHSFFVHGTNFIIISYSNFYVT